MAIGIPQPGVLPGNPIAGPGLAAPVYPATAPRPTSPSEAMAWLLSVAEMLGMNPMELAHMINTNPDTVGAVLDAAGVPSPTPAAGETAEILGPSLEVGQPIDYATDPTQTPPQPGLSSPMPGSSNMIPTGGVTGAAAAEGGAGSMVASGADVAPPEPPISLLPEQQPGVGAPANAPPQTGQPLQKVLSGLQMPPNPQVTPPATPGAPSPGAVDAQSLDAIIKDVLSVARPQAASLTLSQAVRR